MDFTPLDSKQLMALAKTQTYIKNDLSNLEQLNDLEYESLVSGVIGFLTATNPMLLASGACYSKIIYNYDTLRFNSAVFTLMNKNIFDINEYYDFYALDIALSFCGSKVYSDFMKIASESSDNDVREEAQKDLIENSNKAWFKYYEDSYLELISYLKIQ